MWAFVLFLLVPFPLTKIPELILILCPIHTISITFPHMREKGKEKCLYNSVYICMKNIVRYHKEYFLVKKVFSYTSRVCRK